MRLIYVLISIFSAAFPGLLVYIILWIILPEDHQFGQRGMFRKTE
jgi:phage shock protein C